MLSFAFCDLLEKIGNTRADEHAVVLSPEGLAIGGVIVAHLWLHLDIRQRLVVERHRYTGQVLACARRVGKAQRSAGDVRSILVAQEFTTHGPPPLLGQAVRSPNSAAPPPPLASCPAYAPLTYPHT